MIVVLGHLDVRPETIAQMKAAAAELAEASRKENGCIAYAFSNCVTTPYRFYVHEVWESMEAVQKHLALPGVQAFLGFVGTVAAAPPVVTRYDASSSAPLF